MDQEHLVESWVESGREILDHLAKESLTPAVAFWVKRPEKEFRVFYLATDWEPGSVYASLFRLPTLELSVGDIRLLNAGDALAQAAIAIRNRYPGRAATRYRGPRLGPLEIEEVYIYPVPANGPLSAPEVIQRVAGLLGQSGLARPSVVTLADGTSFSGIPTAICRQAANGVRVTFTDAATKQLKEVGVEDVRSIL